MIRQIKSRGVTRYLDLSRVNKQHIHDVEDNEEMMSNSSNPGHVAKRRRLTVSPAPSVSHEPSLANDEVPNPPGPDDAVPNDLTHANEAELPHDVPVPEAEYNLDNLSEPSAEQFPPTPMATSTRMPFSTPVVPDQHASVQPLTHPSLPPPSPSSLPQHSPSSLPRPTHESVPQSTHPSLPQSSPSLLSQSIQPPQPAGETFKQRRARQERQELAPIFN